ncbi:MAG: histidine phosphatase family protein [Myxococcales bacterium]|nr:histidine phosphatase family protein [Myxococcales bacterium]
MEILLIRHARPGWVADGRGVLDPALTPEGEAQAQHLGEAVHAWRRKPKTLWVSPAARARQTAAPVARALGLEPVEHGWLEEIRLPPDWDGAAALDIRGHFATARSRTEAQWWAGIPGGESFHDFEARVTENMAAALGALGIRRRQGADAEAPVYDLPEPDQVLAIVAHGGTNAVLTSYLLGLPMVPWAWERFVTEHASVTRLRAAPLLGGHIFGLREHSDANHVPGHLRSR